jgi:hypothetical protein
MSEITQLMCKADAAVHAGSGWSDGAKDFTLELRTTGVHTYSVAYGMVVQVSRVVIAKGVKALCGCIECRCSRCRKVSATDHRLGLHEYPRRRPIRLPVHRTGCRMHRCPLCLRR